MIDVHKQFYGDFVKEIEKRYNWTKILFLLDAFSGKIKNLPQCTMFSAPSELFSYWFDESLDFTFSVRPFVAFVAALHFLLFVSLFVIGYFVSLSSYLNFSSTVFSKFHELTHCYKTEYKKTIFSHFISFIRTKHIVIYSFYLLITQQKSCKSL